MNFRLCCHTNLPWQLDLSEFIHLEKLQTESLSVGLNVGEPISFLFFLMKAGSDCWRRRRKTQGNCEPLQTLSMVSSRDGSYSCVRIPIRLFRRIGEGTADLCVNKAGHKTEARQANDPTYTLSDLSRLGYYYTLVRALFPWFVVDKASVPHHKHGHSCS